MALTIVKTSYHNIVRECRDDETHLLSNTEVHPHPRIVPFIDAIARKQPSWVFVAIGYGNLRAGVMEYEYSKFRVEVDGEAVGEINAYTHWKDNSTKYVVNNPRLTAGRRGRRAPETKHLDKAVKTVMANFSPQTLDERMRSARGATSGVVSSLQSKAITQEQRLWRSVDGEVMLALINDESLRNRIPLSSPAKVADINGLGDAHEHKTSVTRMVERWNKGKGVTLITRGGTCFVQRLEADTQRYEIAALPPHLAMGLGLLKLASHEAIIPDVGVRVSETVFFIADPETSDE